MAQIERSVGQPEEESLWDSRLFKTGVVIAAAGFLIGAAEMMAVGVIVSGGAWTMKK